MSVPDLKYLYKNRTLSDLHNFATSRTKYGIEYLCRLLLIHRRKEKDEIHFEDIEVCIERGRRWLENQQRPDGSIGELHPRQWEIWNTANAALALIETGGNKDWISNAVNFVFGGQLENGSFFFNYVPKALKENLYCNCIETASVALLAAYKTEKSVSEEVRKGLDFLIKAQNEDGSWELPYIPKNSKYPSVTGYALKTLLYLRVCPPKTFQKALAFLEITQKSNGSWGRALDYYNTESYAIKNISNALILARNEEWLTKEEREKIDMMLQRCNSYIAKKQNHDGSWSAIGPSSKSISTALYLQTMLNLSDEIEKNGMMLIENAVCFLIEKQSKKGFWYGGKLDRYNCDIFATSEVLTALSKASEYMGLKL
jgi:squalene cyclase